MNRYDRRPSRALRLLGMVVLALTAVTYIIGLILDSSWLSLYYSTQPTATLRTFQWPKKIPTLAVQNENPISTNNKNATIPCSQHKKQCSQHMTRQNKAADNNSSSTSLLSKKIMKKIKKNVTTDTFKAKKNNAALPLCENKIPPDFGPIPLNKTELNLDWVQKKFPKVHWGGLYAPKDCTARHRVAIIVPYRNRTAHLPIFLNHMHPFLMKQQIEYGIFVIEQAGNSKFNRARLLNVGFLESRKQKAGWQCFIFHDVDLLPLDLRNIYSCPRKHRHMSVSMDRFHFKLPYYGYFGGVSAMTLDQFTRVNGYSNKYWGWGGEDDNMSNRLNKTNYPIERYRKYIARYAMLSHRKYASNPKRHQLALQTNRVFHNDGLSNLKYEIVDIVHTHLYTLILVNIDELSWWAYFRKLLFGDQQ